MRACSLSLFCWQQLEQEVTSISPPSFPFPWIFVSGLPIFKVTQFGSDRAVPVIGSDGSSRGAFLPVFLVELTEGYGCQKGMAEISVRF